MLILATASACGSQSSTVSPSPTALADPQFTLSADAFTPPDTVFHSSQDKVTYGANWSASASGTTTYFDFAVVFARDDGSTLLGFCGGGLVGTQGARGGGGYAGATVESRGLWTFGVGHSMDAVIIGGPFATGPSAATPCPFGSFGVNSPINWSMATVRLDVPLHWTFQ